jgi:hypothetical protein
MLSQAEKERVRYHMGYPQVQGAASLSFGIPRPIQTAFLLEDAMNNIIAAAEGRVRDLLAKLDVTEANIFGAQTRMQAERVGELTMRRDESQQLREEYKIWAERLADVLGCPLYAYSSKFNGAGNYGSIPVRR